MHQKLLATGAPKQSPIKLLTGHDIKIAVSFLSQSASTLSLLARTEHLLALDHFG
jgi:hypothetical protein